MSITLRPCPQPQFLRNFTGLHIMRGMNQLNARAKQILQLVIDSYINTGAPVGSKKLLEDANLGISSATVRSVMADLERQGYLYAPHTSAGRMPTEAGLTIFVEGMLEVNKLSKKDRDAIKADLESQNSRAVNERLDHTSRLISGLSSCAGLVIAPTSDRKIREVDFIKLQDQRILSILVHDNGEVENRILKLKEDVPVSALRTAANYLNSVLAGQKMSDIRLSLKKRIENDRNTLDKMTEMLVTQGIAELAPKEAGRHLIIRGQANLLENVSAAEDVERVRRLFIALEEKNTLMQMLKAVEGADGVQIFIGAENNLFRHSGCSLILSPYKDAEKNVIGAVGVIGPNHLNYRRVIPVVNYTSEILSVLI